MKYNSYDNIPAKTFFQILGSGDYQLLKPKPSEKNTEETFIAIHDEFFLKSDNAEANEYMSLTNNIKFLEYKIGVIKATVAILFFNPNYPQELLMDILEALEIGCGIFIDKDLDLIDEIQRILQVEIGIIENDLNFDRAAKDDLSKQTGRKEFNYYDELVSLGNALLGNTLVRGDMLLCEYVALKKSALKNNKPK